LKSSKILKNIFPPWSIVQFLGRLGHLGRLGRQFCQFSPRILAVVGFGIVAIAMPFMTLLPSPETRRRWSWKLLGHGAGMCWVQWKSRKASYSLLRSFAWLYATIIKHNMRFHGCKHLSSACFGRMVYFYVAWLQELGADAGFVWFCGCQAQYIDKRSAH